MSQFLSPQFKHSFRANPWQTVSLIILILVATAIMIALTHTFADLSIDDEILRDSTIGELAIWMSDQTQEEEIDSFLGQYAENWAQSAGQETLDPATILAAMRGGLVRWGIVITGVGVGGLLVMVFRPRWLRPTLLFMLMGMDSLLFIIPVIADVSSLNLILAGISILLIIQLMAPGDVSRVLGFFVILSAVFVVWEVSKAWANSNDYKLTLDHESWQYSTYPTLEEALNALDNNEISAVIFDRRDLGELVPPFPPDDTSPADFQYPDLRLLEDLDRTTNVAFLSVEPEFPGRLGIAVQAGDAELLTSVEQFPDEVIATVAGEFADVRYLAEPRRLLLLDMKILNDINLPHLQTIAEAFMQPARRNGSQLLIRILANAGFYTWWEAALGFAFGGILGFILGALFAHSALMERSLLPYVVASQTVPILAIAPMVVIWLGASQTSVSVIAAYLTFFPVTINTLRGLQSPKPTEVELLQSYAANHWTIMWRLRFPAALPYIFTALKVSATASVVGAIIGELPSGIGDGLGRAILDFSSDYSLISTPKLWAAIVMAAVVGIIFFVAVSIVEQLVLGRYIRNS